MQNSKETKPSNDGVFVRGVITCGSSIINSHWYRREWQRDKNKERSLVECSGHRNIECTLRPAHI